MKKVICGLMLVVVLMTMAMVNFAFADGYDDDMELLKYWVSQCGYSDYLDEEIINGIIPEMHYIGVLGANHFKKDSGMDCTVENFITWSKKEYDMISIEVRTVGFAEGREVYVCDAESKSDRLAWKDGVDYTKVSVLFMISDKD